MARIKGNKLTIEFDGVEYSTNLQSLEIEHKESDNKFVTFGDVKAGGAYDATVKGTAYQDDAASSFWTFVWENTGENVPFTTARAGNETATVAEPHFTGIVKIGAKPKIGGAAGEAETWSFDFEWNVQGEVTKVTA